MHALPDRTAEGRQQEQAGLSYLDSVVKMFGRPGETPEAVSVFGCNREDQEFVCERKGIQNVADKTWSALAEL